MLIVHDVFRREFALMPGLIGTVAPDDRTGRNSSPTTSTG